MEEPELYIMEPELTNTEPGLYIVDPEQAPEPPTIDDLLLLRRCAGCGMLLLKYTHDRHLKMGCQKSVPSSSTDFPCPACELPFSSQLSMSQHFHDRHEQIPFTGIEVAHERDVKDIADNLREKSGICFGTMKKDSGFPRLYRCSRATDNNQSHRSVRACTAFVHVTLRPNSTLYMQICNVHTHSARNNPYPEEATRIIEDLSAKCDVHTITNVIRDSAEKVHCSVWNLSQTIMAHMDYHAVLYYIQQRGLRTVNHVLKDAEDIINKNPPAPYYTSLEDIVSNNQTVYQSNFDETEPFPGSYAYDGVSQLESHTDLPDNSLETVHHEEEIDVETVFDQGPMLAEYSTSFEYEEIVESIDSGIGITDEIFKEEESWIGMDRN